MNQTAPRQTIEEFNAEQSANAREIQTRMKDAGFDVSPEECRFMLVCGWKALGTILDVDTAVLDPTLRKLAVELPKAAR